MKRTLAAAITAALCTTAAPSLAAETGCGYVGRLVASARFFTPNLGPAGASSIRLSGGCALFSGSGWMSGWCDSAVGEITFELDWISPGYRLTSQFAWSNGVLVLTGGVTGSAVMTADVASGQTCLPVTGGANAFLVTAP